MGRLYVVGTGIRLAGQITIESRNVICSADRVFALMADPFALDGLRDLSPSVISLSGWYGEGRSRDQSYAAMVEQILTALDQSETVAAVFYGHPGMFVWPSHEVVRQARKQGHAATMLPGISAEDCLVADLGLDPGVSGLQTYEACDFLVYPRRFDPAVPMVLWQLAVLGDLSRSTFVTDPLWMAALAELLIQDYPSDHPVTLYEAVSFPLDEPRIETISLAELGSATVSQATTLYVPPRGPPSIDRERLRALGLDADRLAEAGFQKARRRQWNQSQKDTLD